MSRKRIEQALGGLNPPQREAVTTTDGPLLVLAGAGTGKTRVVTVRIAHLLARGVEPENVLAVTFTNKAAREMRDRVAGLVGKKAAKGLTISTFHSFSLRLLRDHGEALGLRRGFTIADDEDRQLLVRTALRDLGVHESTVAPRWGAWRISRWKNDGLDAAAAMSDAADDAEITLAHAYARVEEEMRRRQCVDFDDMILLGLKLVEDHEDVRRRVQDRFRHLMVDEYQDTNPTQFRMLRHLAGARRNIAVVGDDDQSIYGWRGAEPGLILSFDRHFPGARIVKLEQNYRSTNRILEAANAVISVNGSRLEKKLWSALGEGERIELYKAEDEREELTRLVTRLDALHRDGVAYGDVAVLFRANAQSASLEARLRERGIPYRVVGTWSLFDRREVKDLLAYLKIVANPRDDGALLRVLNRPSRGIGNGTRDRLVNAATERRCGLAELLVAGDEVAGVAAAQAGSVAALGGLLRELESAGRRGARPVLDLLVERVGYRAFLELEAKDPLEAQVRWNVVETLLEIAERHDATGEGGVGGFLEKLALERQPESKDDREEDRGVTLLTVHAAKGLEFPHVFVIGVEEGLFPHKNSFNDEEGTDTIDEERRLFYVAVTRARRSLTLSMAKTRTRWGRVEEREESRFVGEIGADLLTFVDKSSEGPADEAAATSFLDRLKGLVADSEEA